MKNNISGDELVALAATISIELAKDKDADELRVLIELLCLLRQNLEVIKNRCSPHKKDSGCKKC